MLLNFSISLMNMVFCFSFLAVIYSMTFKTWNRYFFFLYAVQAELLVLSSLWDHGLGHRGWAGHVGTNCDRAGIQRFLFTGSHQSRGRRGLCHVRFAWRRRRWCIHSKCISPYPAISVHHSLLLYLWGVLERVCLSMDKQQQKRIDVFWEANRDSAPTKYNMLSHLLSLVILILFSKEAKLGLGEVVRKTQKWTRVKVVKPDFTQRLLQWRERYLNIEQGSNTARTCGGLQPRTKTRVGGRWGARVTG